MKGIAMLAQLNNNVSSLGIRIRSSDMPEDAEVIRLRRRFDKHLDEFRLYVVEQEHINAEHRLAQELTSRNINDLLKALELQAKSTEGLVEAWVSVNFFRKAIIWASGFSGIGVFIAWYNEWFTK